MGRRVEHGLRQPQRQRALCSQPNSLSPSTRREDAEDQTDTEGAVTAKIEMDGDTVTVEVSQASKPTGSRVSGRRQPRQWSSAVGTYSLPACSMRGRSWSMRRG